MMVENNSLWAAELPIDQLPDCSSQVNVTWVLETVFILSILSVLIFPTLTLMSRTRRGGSIRVDITEARGCF